MFSLPRDLRALSDTEKYLAGRKFPGQFQLDVSMTFNQKGFVFSERAMMDDKRH